MAGLMTAGGSQDSARGPAQLPFTGIKDAQALTPDLELHIDARPSGRDLLSVHPEVSG